MPELAVVDSEHKGFGNLWHDAEVTNKRCVPVLVYIYER
jgi:hypothetical protein